MQAQNHAEAVAQGTLSAFLVCVALAVIGSIAWWSFTNTQTLLGGLFTSVMLCVLAAPLYGLVMTPLAGLLGVLAGGVVALVEHFRPQA